MLESQSKPPAETSSPLHLLSLPYDIRWIIYSHLFPSLQQVYLMASKEGINPMMRPGSLKPDIFLTCRQLQAEASDYFFNNYLFNIIGYKQHCMAHYKPLYELMDRYAKHGASVEVLDNGTLSSTACVTIHAKDGHVEATLRARRRGVPRDLKEVEEEVAQMPDILDESNEYSYALFVAKTIDCVAFVADKLRMVSTPAMLTTVFATGIAILIAMLYSSSD